MNFADPIDEAQERQQQYLTIALKSRPLPMEFTGKCFNCAAPILRGQFCESACCEDYSKRERAQKLSRH